ncbi:glycosyltransferase [Parapedobacter sp. DT-150]|uniref:glycosyltransferase n=1 Tax=Parapedobacter sp. DT-150 TaxID=3396162 RepID=UPI003F19DF6C
METPEREITGYDQHLGNGISVVLCTHNGASKLPETIKHLSAQQVPKEIPWEVIFVDNHSSDDSMAVVQGEWHKQQVARVPFRCFEENRPAKYFALQTAITHARYRYFVICDDDNWFDPQYIERMYTLLDTHPEVGAAGGQGIPVTEEGVVLPDWFSEYSEGYAVGKQGSETGYVTKRGYLWGAGLGSRTAVYRAFYQRYPSFLFMHDDSSILTTEDTEYCLRLILRGYELYYDEALKFHHFIPKEKLSRAYMHALYKKNHEGFVITGKYYLAIKLYKKNGRIKPLSRLRLKILTPIRLWLARTEKRRIREKTILAYLFPSKQRGDTVASHIVDFLKDSELPRF